MNKKSSKLEAGQVHLYWAWISDLNPKAEELLSSDELQHYSQLTHNRRKQEFLASRFILSSVLGSYLNQAPVIKREQGRKPRLVNGDLYFNLTHSQDMILLALSSSAEIGVDLEYLKERKLHQNFKARYFSKSEQEQIKDLKSFYQHWTRKEAYLKCTGEGISSKLEEIDTYNLEGFYFYPLEIKKDYVGCLASKKASSIQYFSVNPTIKNFL